MIYFGYSPEYRPIGWWGGWCPLCEAPRPFRVCDVFRVNHIYGISLRDGMWVGRVVRCHICFGITDIGVDDQVIVMTTWDPAKDFGTLAAQTNPDLHPSFSVDSSSPTTSAALLRRCYYAPVSREMDSPYVATPRQNALVLLVVALVMTPLFLFLPPSYFADRLAPDQLVIGLIYFVAAIIAAGLVMAYLSDLRDRRDREEALLDSATRYGIPRAAFEQVLDHGVFTPNASRILRRCLRILNQ